MDESLGSTQMNYGDLRAAALQALEFCEDLQRCYWGDLETVIEDLRAALDVTEKATMNHDDIVRMAQECGLTVNDAPMLGVEHFANLVAAAEREACARVCESAKAWELESQYQGDIYAAAIRARGGRD